MGNQTSSTLQDLDQYLQSIYSTAANDIASQHGETLQQIADYDEAQYSYIQDERQRRMQIYMSVLQNESAAFWKIAAIIAAAGLVACNRIRDASAVTLEQSYRLTIGGFQQQLGSNAPQWWNYLPREELRSRIQESAFTRVAFNRLGYDSNLAQRRIMQRLRTQMMGSILAGEGVDGLMARVRAITRSSYYDARRITRTELMRCANQGRYEAAQQAYRDYGIRARKIWIHTPTAITPRDDHIAMNGVAAGEDGYFTLPNGERALYPLDPNLSAEQSIHCSCTFVCEVIL